MESVVVKMLLKSKPVLQILVTFVVISIIHAKRYERCELARELKERHKLPANQIATWVCIVKYESNYNTDARNKDSGDHGLFQISQLFWCSPPGEGRACNRACKDFRDEDITDDVACIKRIYREHQRLSGDGFNAWVAYQHYCRGDVSHYTENCFTEKHNISSTSPPPESETKKTKPVKVEEKGAVDTFINLVNFVRPLVQSTTTTPKPGVFSGLFSAVVSNLNPFASRNQENKKFSHVKTNIDKETTIKASSTPLVSLNSETSTLPFEESTKRKVERKYTINDYEISRSSSGFSIRKNV